MNSTGFNILFASGCILLYLPSLWAKFTFSGRHHTRAKFFIAFSYNLLISHFHWRFVETGNLPFLGVYEPEPMGWLSLFMVLAYAYALPSERNSKFCFRK